MYDFDVLESLPAFLTREEVAKVLRISLSTVDRAIASGELEHFKVGKRRVLFTKESIRKFLKLKRYEPEKRVVLSSGELDYRLKLLETKKELKELLPQLEKFSDIISDEKRFSNLSEELQGNILNEYSAVIEKISELQDKLKKLEVERDESFDVSGDDERVTS